MVLYKYSNIFLSPLNSFGTFSLAIFPSLAVASFISMSLPLLADMVLVSSCSSRLSKRFSAGSIGSGEV